MVVVICMRCLWLGVVGRVYSVILLLCVMLIGVF